MANIKDIRKLEEIQRSYLFEVYLKGDLAGLLSDEDVVTLRAQEVNLPEHSVEQIGLPYKGTTTYHRGRDSSGHTFSISFVDTQELKTYGLFKFWLDILLQNTVSGGGFGKDIYSATIEIETQEIDEETSSGAWRFPGAFPLSLSEVNLNYDSEESFNFTVDFSFDGHLFGKK